MQIADIMTRSAHVATPDETLQEVARQMINHDIGFLPVVDQNGLAGTITDRDIVVRAIAAGRDGTTHVGDIMTTNITCCFEDEDVDEVVGSMGTLQLRRLAVLDRNNRLVGVVSLADAARGSSTDSAGDALREIVEPRNGEEAQKTLF
ncbi:MAG: CBS domain-containing protein [Shinella sp.]|nr:CBS domain-containing protein [Shinella sp.]